VSASGRETELQLPIANQGDEPAVGLQVDAYSHPPFTAMTLAESFCDLSREAQ